MNHFGPTLEKSLAEHNIGKTEFATACSINRNQLTNIISGKAKTPYKIEQIFSTARDLLPVHECLMLAIAYLEDRRTDTGYSSADIAIQKYSGETFRPARARLIALYDSDSDIRAALDIIVSAMSDDPAEQKPARGADPHGAGERSESSTPVRYPTPSESKRKKGTKE